MNNLRYIRLLSIGLIGLSLLVGSLPTAAQQPTMRPMQTDINPNDDCPVTNMQGQQTSGAFYCIWLPPTGTEWNGSLVVYARGYELPVPDQVPTGIFYRDNISETYGEVPETLPPLGYAVIMTSFSTNGLNTAQGLNELPDLVDIFTAQHNTPQKTYLVGLSQGGLPVTLLAEQTERQRFNAAMTVCGLNSSYRDMTNYVGDMRIVFDYFYPDVLPGAPDNIPPELLNNWSATYSPALRTAIITEPQKAEQLLRVVNAPVGDLIQNLITIELMMTFQVFGYNDALSKLGGAYYDNQNRVYAGSGDPTVDSAINANVTRFTIDETVANLIETTYTTSGTLQIPLVTTHNTQDPLVPYRTSTFYGTQVEAAGKANLYQHIPVNRYGHCFFTEAEFLQAFNAMLALEAEQSTNNLVVYLPMVVR